MSIVTRSRPRCRQKTRICSASIRHDALPAERRGPSDQDRPIRWVENKYAYYTTRYTIVRRIIRRSIRLCYVSYVAYYTAYSYRPTLRQIDRPRGQARKRAGRWEGGLGRTVGSGVRFRRFCCLFGPARARSTN
eukprot:1004576-Prorocentrum_minimum.AAC.2